MSVFVIVLLVGLGGLALMALPAMRRQGRAGHAHGQGRAGQAYGQGRAGHAHGQGRAGQAHGQRGRGVDAAHGSHGHSSGQRTAGSATSNAAHTALDSLFHYLPEPRMVFSTLALFGAFGNVLVHAAHLSFWPAAAGALAVALFLEWLVVGRLWRLAERFGGEPSSPLDSLILDRAQAVTPFRNGKGIVRVVLDGRSVQLSAELVPEDGGERIRVGTEVTIQEVDSEHERVLVSLR